MKEMNALEFYKSHESAPLPNVSDLVSLTVEELCELMEQYHQSKVNNGVLYDVSNRRELLIATLIGWEGYKKDGVICTIDEYVAEVESNL